PPRMTSARDSGVPGAREPKASATCCSISARARPITSSTAADSSAGAMVRYLEVWNFSSVISPLAFTFALTVLSLDTASAVADSRFALASARLRCVSRSRSSSRAICSGRDMSNAARSLPRAGPRPTQHRGAPARGGAPHLLVLGQPGAAVPLLVARARGSGAHAAHRGHHGRHHRPHLARLAVRARGALGAPRPLAAGAPGAGARIRTETGAGPGPEAGPGAGEVRHVERPAAGGAPARVRRSEGPATGEATARIRRPEGLA